MGQLICGDAREVLAGMHEGSVHACITSPPYWGLRDYGGPDSVFGGDEGCEHEWGERLPEHHPGQVPDTKWQSNTKLAEGQTKGAGQFCQLCGAWRGQFRLGPTPEMYVEHTLEFLRAIRRVLRDDGTCWWVIGDTYSGGHRRTDKAQTFARGDERDLPIGHRPCRDLDHPSIKPKDLVMIPFRVALAAQADGWFVRSVIIWSKPNPMPESVRDRPTTAHEYVLLLTKQARYFYDADAIREPSVYPNDDRKGRPSENQKRMPDEMVAGIRPGSATYPRRNKRTVWEIATQPYKGPHYATFPPKLVEPMILTTPTKVCAECGAGWERVTQSRDTGQRMKMPDGWDTGTGGHGSIHRAGREKGEARKPVMETQTVGFRPSCSCPGLDGDGPGSDCADYDTNWPTKPAVILDPCCGTGTTLWQANALGRDWIGIDIDPKSIEMAKERMGLFAPYSQGAKA